MIDTPLWKEIGLIGRDNLLKRKILPRVKSQTKRFIIKGDIGVGKTALLEWAQEHTPGSALINCCTHYGGILDILIEAWGIETDAKKVAEKETAVLQSAGNTLYADDLHKATPKLIAFLKVLSERNKVSGAMRSGIRIKEELKQLLWSCETYKLPRLARKDALRLSEKICLHFGARLSAVDVANAASGLPARIVNTARTGEIQRDEVRTQAEEIDIAPVFLMLAAGLMVFRYLGRVTDATDFVLLGGVGMVGLIFVRGIFQKGKEK